MTYVVAIESIVVVCSHVVRFYSEGHNCIYAALGLNLV